MQTDKLEAEKTNRNVMAQVANMKQAIKDSRECEIVNQELLEKNKLKNEKII